jgi:hypothetical protein
MPSVLLLVLATTTVLSQPVGSTPRPYCDLARETPLDMPIEDFENGPEGWRVWGEGGCDSEAADLIASYRARWPDLDPGRDVILRWHEAQLRAMVGDAQALPLIESIQGKAASPATELYHQATLHFLRNDRQAFQATRDKLAALPEPPQFARARAAFSEKYGQPGPVWPLNLDVVDSLAACFGLPYRQAYSCTKDAQP